MDEQTPQNTSIKTGNVMLSLILGLVYWIMRCVVYLSYCNELLKHGGQFFFKCCYYQQLHLLSNHQTLDITFSRPKNILNSNFALVNASILRLLTNLKWANKRCRFVGKCVIFAPLLIFVHDGSYMESFIKICINAYHRQSI